MVETAVQEQEEVGGGEAERERSTIQFPYADQNNARRIALAIHEKGGSSLSWDQLAAHLGVAVRGGGFRLMAAAAKVFGLVTYSGQGNVQITQLGRKIVDPANEAAARVESFKAVPLYRRIFDEFKGGQLPPTNEALENEMVRFGVSKKVADRARQTFQRSALQAGFFAYGQDRLVEPVTSTDGSRDRDKDPAKDHRDRHHVGGGSGGGGGRDPLLQGLINKLPAEGSDWSLDDRAAWLELAKGIFDFVYGKSDDGTLKIEIARRSA